MNHRSLLTLATLVVAGILAGCSSGQGVDHRDKVVVSIAPLAYLVEAIADSTVAIEVLVPETTSPETYEPTISQLKSLSKAKVYIAIGLIDFEVELKEKIEELAPNAQYVDLSQGIDLMQGTCSHVHNHDTDHGHAHSGVDPHIWLSPRLLKIMSANIAQSLCSQLPENKDLYIANLHKLYSELDSLNSFINSKLSNKKFRKFAIAHPSLSYFAQDYKLEQIPIEVEGKEPTAGQLSALISRLKGDSVTSIFYQRQVSGGSIDVIASHIGGQGVEFDPLAGDLAANLRDITLKLNQALR